MACPPSEMISADTLNSILRNPLDYTWRAHGIGMLRTYLDPATKNWRLHLWHPRLIVPGISLMHTHPWTFKSWVIAGRLSNQRWIRSGGGPRSKLFMEGIILCGTMARPDHEFGIEGDPHSLYLSAMSPEFYGPGETYQQDPEEIHESHAREGTITIMHRSEAVGDGRASVFWPHGTPWGDASRGTSREDVLETAAAALAALNETSWRIP